MTTFRPDRGIRRVVYVLALVAVTLVTAGALSDMWWLLSLGVWLLVLAGLIEMVYRP